MTTEIWKDFPDKHKLSRYQVSNKGQIKNIKTDKILKSARQNTGYIYIKIINDNGKRHSCAVHRLVAYAFHENPSNKPEVDHINRNCSDNNALNLQWVTKKENAQNKNHSRKGRPREIVQYNMKDEFIKIWPSIKEAGIGLKLHPSGIRQVCAGIMPRYKVWKFKYIEDYEDINPSEIWKSYTINSYTCNVSNLGRLKYKSGKITRGNKASDEYCYVTLGKPRRFHRIIMKAFNPIKYSNLFIVNHKDENKSNNNLDNLEWCLSKYNSEYSCAIPVVQYSIDMIFIRIYKSVSEAGRLTRISPSSIVKACKQTSYSHAGGFKWKHLSDTELDKIKQCPIKGVNDKIKSIDGELDKHRQIVLSDKKKIVTIYDTLYSASEHLNKCINIIQNNIINKELIDGKYDIGYLDMFDKSHGLLGEEWKLIDNDRFFSNYGRLKYKNDKITKGDMCKDGTRRVKYNKKYVKAHILVMHLFGSKNINDTQLNIKHKDMNKDNNHIDNLVLYSKKRKVGRYDLNEKHLKSFNTISEAAEFYKIGSSKISAACKNQYKTYKSSKWRYED